MIELKVEHESDTRVKVSLRMLGATDPLLDELAAGMAHAIIRIADDLKAADEIHESLARVTASKMISMVAGEMHLRDEQSSSNAERAARDKPAEA